MRLDKKVNLVVSGIQYYNVHMFLITMRRILGTIKVLVLVLTSSQAVPFGKTSSQLTRTVDKSIRSVSGAPLHVQL